MKFTQEQIISSVLFFKSRVNSRVCKTTRSHSLQAVSFLAFVSSPSAFPTEGILNKDRSLVRLVEQPKSAQLEPVIVQLPNKNVESTKKNSSLRISM